MTGSAAPLGRHLCSIDIHCRHEPPRGVIIGEMTLPTELEDPWAWGSTKMPRLRR